MALKRVTDTQPSEKEPNFGRVGRRGHPVTKPLGVSLGGTVASADLGGSSKYSNEIFED